MALPVTVTPSTDVQGGSYTVLPDTHQTEQAFSSPKPVRVGGVSPVLVLLVLY